MLDYVVDNVKWDKEIVSLDLTGETLDGDGEEAGHFNQRIH